MTIDEIKKDLETAREEAAARWRCANSLDVAAEGKGQTNAYDHALGLLNRYKHPKTPRQSTPEDAMRDWRAMELDTGKDSDS